jgi:hypothetical protein
MPKQQSTGSKKARTAARAGAKFTTALRKTTAPGTPPEREVWVDDLGGEIWDEDRVRNALWDREGSWGSPDAVLAEQENWHYDQVEFSWMERASERLGVHGIRWEPESDRATLPAGMTDAEASRLWGEVVSGFEAWIDEIVEETRRGKPDGVEYEVRGDGDPGGLWVVAVDEMLPGLRSRPPST